MLTTHYTHWFVKIKKPFEHFIKWYIIFSPGETIYHQSLVSEFRVLKRLIRHKHLTGETVFKTRLRLQDQLASWESLSVLRTSQRLGNQSASWEPFSVLGTSQRFGNQSVSWNKSASQELISVCLCHRREPNVEPTFYKRTNFASKFRFYFENSLQRCNYAVIHVFGPVKFDLIRYT